MIGYNVNRGWFVLTRIGKNISLFYAGEYTPMHAQKDKEILREHFKNVVAIVWTEYDESYRSSNKKPKSARHRRPAMPGQDL